MGTGAAFYVGESGEINTSPLDARCNTMFTLTDGRAVFILDCNKTQNQVSFVWRENDEELFDPLRGPDPLSSTLYEHINGLLDDKQHEDYFEVKIGKDR
jgi:hypothetical protein